ncbi:MAG TPA: DUF1508 domain-containing protein [Candidatus Paceibacterota bacterium]
MMKNKIIIKTAKNKQTYVTVKGGNNKVIATTETYERLHGAMNAAKALKRVIKNAEILDKTKKLKR